MKMTNLITAFLLFAAVSSSGDPTYTVSGYVIDKKTGETIIGVNVVVHGTSMGSVTDGNGYFRVSGLGPGRQTLDFSHIAYESTSMNFDILNKGLMLDDIPMQSKALEFKEIVITAKKTNVADNKTDTGYREITPKAILSIPDARKDVFGAIKYLPGIEGVDPISPLFSVRGSDPGENLILLDGVTIYNPYHYVQAAGIFNLNAIKNVEMLVGGFGAEYGGRNSSVLYITTREGNNEALHGEIEPTLSYTNAVFDFPVGRNATMMVSGRAYYDLVSRFLLNSPSYFYDTNISLNWIINNKNRLSLRYFFSKDLNDFQTADFFSYLKETFDMDLVDNFDFRLKTDWSNQAATAVLKTVISPKLYLKTQVSVSSFASDNLTLLDFTYKDKDTDETIKLYTGTEIQNRITDISGKSVLSMKLGSDNTLSLGGEVSHYHFDNDFLINQLSEGKTARTPDLYAGFIEDKFRLGPMTFRPGLRFSKFSYSKPWYHEPRMNAACELPWNARLKAAWGKYYQYIISVNSQEYEPSQFVDNYYPLKNREPGASTHTILGLEKTLSANSSISIDVYYKKITRVYTFDYHVNELEAYGFSDKLKTGTGKSYGIEFLWQGTWRRFSGWISYSIGKSTRSYPHIMNGKTFLFDYDRTHAFKAVISHQINPRLSYSGTLRILSGVPKTIESTTKSYFYYDPVSGAYSIYPVGYNATKNNARLPLYVQLDLGIKKRIRKGFGAELAEFLGAKESYMNFSFNNLLFFFHRNVWFYIPMDEDKLYGLGTNYIPTFSAGYTIKF